MNYIEIPTPFTSLQVGDDVKAIDYRTYYGVIVDKTDMEVLVRGLHGDAWVDCDFTFYRL